MNEESSPIRRENEITKLCNARDSTFSETDEPHTGGNATLPGQVLEFTDSDETSKSSDSDFDLGNFRNAIYPEKTILEVEAQEMETTTSNFVNVKVIKFLGINFDVAILQERNKDPILFLKVVSFLYFITCTNNFITYLPGTNFGIAQSILTTYLNLAVLIHTVIVCKTSTKNITKFKLLESIVIASFALTSQGLFLFAYLVKMPFNSQTLYLLMLYFNLIAIFTQVEVQQNADFTPWDHPNYQQIYFFNKSSMGFFNGTAFMDIGSDFILGIQLVIRFRNHFLILGILLLILCGADVIFLLRRSYIVKEKVSWKENLVVAINEIMIILITVIVMYAISTKGQEQDDETFFVVVISLSTTLISLLHQLFFTYQKFVANYQQDRVLDFSRG